MFLLMVCMKGKQVVGTWARGGTPGASTSDGLGSTLVLSSCQCPRGSCEPH